MTNADDRAFSGSKVVHTYIGPTTQDWPGLTKREYFAGKALEGIISSQRRIDSDFTYEINSVANLAVGYVDALIERLNRIEEK